MLTAGYQMVSNINSASGGPVNAVLENGGYYNRLAPGC